MNHQIPRLAHFKADIHCETDGAKGGKAEARQTLPTHVASGPALLHNHQCCQYPAKASLSSPCRQLSEVPEDDGGVGDSVCLVGTCASHTLCGWTGVPRH